MKVMCQQPEAVIITFYKSGCVVCQKTVRESGVYRGGRNTLYICGNDRLCVVRIMTTGFDIGKRGSGEQKNSTKKAAGTHGTAAFRERIILVTEN